MRIQSFRHQMLIVLAIAATACGCGRIIANNLVAGIHDAAVGSATGIIDAFFGDRFGFTGDGGGVVEEGNDLHVRI